MPLARLLEMAEPILPLAPITAIVCFVFDRKKLSKCAIFGQVTANYVVNFQSVLLAASLLTAIVLRQEITTT